MMSFNCAYVFLKTMPLASKVLSVTLEKYHEPSFHTPSFASYRFCME